MGRRLVMPEDESLEEESATKLRMYLVDLNWRLHDDPDKFDPSHPAWPVAQEQVAIYDAAQALADDLTAQGFPPSSILAQVEEFVSLRPTPALDSRLAQVDRERAE